MWFKVAASIAGVALAFLLGFFGHQLIAGFAAASHAAGMAEASQAQTRSALAANAAQAAAALANRDVIIAAADANARELARLGRIVLAANDKVDAYANTDAGRAPCLAPDRVHDIERDRSTLFPPAAEASASEAGPVPAEPIGDPPGS